MTSAVYRNAPVSSVPLSQNTAPVYEHNCLWTHDIRRKQKRWQDGLLRYHTFNQRVLVFDQAGNKVGDTHWNGNVPLQEGDEVTLEKWGVLVDVSERLRQTATDLSEIRGPQRRTSPLRPASIPLRSPAPGVTYQAVSQPKHKSLNTLLSKDRNTPSRTHSPARPTYSASTENAVNHAKADGRPAKRIRVDTPSVQRDQRDSGIQIRETSNSLASRGTSARITEPHKQLPTSVPKKVPEIIDLCEEPLEEFQGFSSDILLPSPVRPPPDQQVGMRKASTDMQSSRAPNPRVMQRKPDVIESEPVRRIPPARSNLVARQPPHNDIENRMPADANASLHGVQNQLFSINPPPKKLQTVALKVAPTVPRRKKGLLCQNQLLPQPGPNNNDAFHGPSVAPVRQPVLRWTISPEPQMEHEPEPRVLSNRGLPGHPMDLHSDPDDEVPRVIRADVGDASTLQKRRAPSDVLPRVSSAEIRKAAAAAGRKRSPAQRNPSIAASRPKKSAAGPPDSVVTAGQLPVSALADLADFSEPVAKQAPMLPHKVTKKKTPPAVARLEAAPKDLGPWSREAFDLFVWRPPGWNEEKWCVEIGG